MAVEHVNYSDTLRQGTDKINAAIDQSNEAMTEASEAKSTADEAKNIANSVQDQLNQVVVEGDSSVEAAQARVGTDGYSYTTLKERLDTEYSNLKNDIIALNTSKQIDILSYLHPFSFDSANYIADWCTVGNMIYQFIPGDNTTRGTIIEIDARTMKLTGRTITHNLGHVNTVSYDPLTDTLICGTRYGNLDILPQLIFINNPTSYFDNGVEIDPDNASDANIIKIDFEDLGVHLYGLKSDELGYIYAFNELNSFYKIQLGLGSNDLSNNGYGSFISGKSATQLNGTARVVQTFTGTSLEFTQGAEFNRGKIYVGYGFGTPDTYAEVYEITLKETGVYVVSNVFRIDKAHTEVEGVTFYNNRMYYSVIDWNTRKNYYVPNNEVKGGVSTYTIPLTLMNGVQMQSGSIPFNMIVYELGNLKVVRIIGQFKNITTNDIQVAQIPTGYYPKDYIGNHMVVMPSNNADIARWEITTDGKIMFKFTTKTNRTPDDWYPLDTTYFII